MSPRRLRFGLKVAQMGGTYAEIRDAWLEADRLGFDTAWAHDHLLNQNDHSKSEDEGWTILTALLTEARRIRGGLMVTANTFRHPAVLAKIATTASVQLSMKTTTRSPRFTPRSTSFVARRSEARSISL